jgi:hypothetical protein
VRAGAAGTGAPPKPATLLSSHATKATATSIRLPLAKEATLSPRRAQPQLLRQEATALRPNVQEPAPTLLPTEKPPSAPPPDETAATSRRPSAIVRPLQQPPLPPPPKAALTPVNRIAAPLVAVVLVCTATDVQVMLDFHPGIPGTLKPPATHVSAMGRPLRTDRFDYVAAI